LAVQSCGESQWVVITRNTKWDRKHCIRWTAHSNCWKISTVNGDCTSSTPYVTKAQGHTYLAAPADASP